MPSVSQILRESGQAFNGEERSNADNTLREIAEFVMPQQSDYFQARPSKGEKKTTRLFDNTAILANNDLSSTMQATLTNPAQKWVRLGFKDKELTEDKPSAEWLQNAGNSILEELAGSNFYTEGGRALQFLTGLGTMAISHNEKDPSSDTFSGFQFKAQHLAHTAWTENADGVVDKVFFEYEMSLRQIKEKGWGLTDKEERRYKKEPDATVQVLYCTYPDGGGKYTKYYINKDQSSLLHEDSVEELPEYVVRWNTAPNETIGRGPSHDALPNIKTLNRAVKEGLKAKALKNRPPLLMEQDTAIGVVDLRPGHGTVVTNIDGIKPLNIGADTNSQELTEQRLIESIQRTYLLDKLMLPPRTQTGEMTAYEVSQRIEQTNKVIGPTLARVIIEWLQPTILRAFKMMFRKNYFPEPPKAIRDKGTLDVDIMFENPLTRAQNFEEISNVQNYVALLSNMAQFDETAKLMFDTPVALAGIAKKLGVPESYVPSPKEVKDELDKQRQSAGRGQQLEQMLSAAQIDKLQQGQ